MMKKEYLKPEMDVTEFVSSVLMNAGSTVVGEEGEGGPDDFGANERRGGSWGDFWN